MKLVKLSAENSPLYLVPLPKSLHSYGTSEEDVIWIDMQALVNGQSAEYEAAE